jgi:hypothetical protein
MPNTLANPPHETRLRISNGDIYIILLSILLCGYTILGRGFAYLGFSPIYIGEMVLLAAIILFILTPSAWKIFSNIHIQVLLIFMAWGLFRTVPYIPKYGMLALRDGAIWGYGIFGIIIAGFLLSNPKRLVVLIKLYQRFIPIFAIAMLILFPLSLVITFPNTPGSAVPIVNFRGGTLMVHTTGAVLFLLLLANRINWGYMLLLFGNLLIWGTRNRGGLLSFLMAFTTVLIIKPSSQRSIKLITAALLLSLIIVLIGFEIPAKKERSISPQQLITNINSIFTSGQDAPMQHTKEFRIQWWATVINYTIFGPYMWLGKGYGINLADADGFQVTGDKSLRSPHNGHITFLARSGLPGLLLWLLLIGIWLLTLFKDYFHARRSGYGYWSNLFLFLFSFSIAFLVNASFDVFLEGPMGGVWFWTMFGISVAASKIYKSYPGLFDIGH